MSKVKSFIQEIADKLNKDFNEVTQEDFDKVIDELNV